MTPAQELLDLWREQTKDYAVVLIDPHGFVVGWEGAAERIFQFSAVEALGQKASFIFTEEDRRKGIPRLETAIAADGGRSENARWHLRKDGSRFYGSGSVTALRSAAGTLVGFAKVLRDRTHAQTELQALKHRVNAQLRRAAQQKLTLLGLLHELRNPLAPLLNVVKVLEKSGSPSELLAVIARQVHALQRLMDDLAEELNETAHEPSGRDFTSIDLRRVVAAVHSACLPEAAMRSQRMELSVPDLPVMVKGDALRLEQALLNIVNNAMKYTPDGGRIWVKCTAEVTSGVVRVEDTGIGIDARQLPRIFEMFVRAHSDADHAPAGDGIGLAVVKRIAAEHGGLVEVRSDGSGKGTEFSLKLPLERSMGMSG